MLELPKRFRSTRIFDLSQFYPAFVPFTVNSIYPVHRWYKFKEGYSKDLVHLILGSLGIKVLDCLDPFGGSGTTALACQEVGIKCHSVEVNPFLHHLAKVKLNSRYTVKGFDKAAEFLKCELPKYKNEIFDEPIMSTLTERPGLEKWLFSKETLQAILSLRHCFAELAPLYRDLFLVILASILTEIGNTRKDGKCVRYKKNWNKNQVTREQVINLLFKKASLVREDIQHIERRKPLEVKNLSLCLQGSALGKLKRLPMNSVDAVITSPPYLNSFDYTDVYMPELWALGFVESYEDVRKLRRATLCSHVQVKWRPDEERIDNGLKALISEIVQDKEELWNGSIPRMIAGYFLDMETLLSEIRRVLRPKGKLSIVVGTSSYYGVVIPTDILLAGIAEDIGFKFEEIRIVRTFKVSTQQLATSTSQSPLRESILTFSLP